MKIYVWQTVQLYAHNTHKQKIFFQIDNVESKSQYNIRFLIKGFRKANIILPRGTKFTIDNALFSSQTKRNLLSFKDLCCNGYHIETDRKIEYLYIISTVSYEKHILEKLPTLSSRLYCSHIRVIETYATMNLKFVNPQIFTNWRDQLSHLRPIMM